MANPLEIALRASANGLGKPLTADSNAETQETKAAAENKAQQLSMGSSSSQTSMQKEAIAVALKVVEVAFIQISRLIDNLKNKRLSFETERVARIATFIRRTNIEERKLYTQERVMGRFFDLIKKYNSFESYCGIRRCEANDLNDSELWAAIPYCSMSANLGQPFASNSSINKARIAIYYFFKTELPEAIAKIDNDFQTDNDIIQFFKSAFKRGNYLNDLRAPRFIIMSLSNLLWNLQQPVDIKTGFPLGTNDAIALCTQALTFLNKLLDPNDACSIQKISKEYPLRSFVCKVENHIKALRAAYIEEQLYELNIDDLANGAHRILRSLTQAILKLIYTQKNPVTQKMEPDENASEEIAYGVSYLNQLLINNPSLIESIAPYANRAKGAPYLNSPPTSLMDILIIFAHCSSHDKDALLEHLAKNPSDNVNEFILTLKRFKEKFIAPIKEVSKQELGASFFDHKSKEVAQLTASRFISIIAGVIDICKVAVETQDSRTKAGANKSILLAVDQVKNINCMAIKQDGYYALPLSKFVELQPNTEAQLDELPKIQRRIADTTKLIDSIREIVNNYRSFLQLKSFQDFLIKCLAKIKMEFNGLEHQIQNIDDCLKEERSMSRNMQSILGNMTSELNKCLDSFSAATENFKNIVTDPGFIERQKESLASKFKEIHRMYTELFGGDSGIMDIPTNLCAPKHKRRRRVQGQSVEQVLPQVPAPSTTPVVESEQVKQAKALRGLVDHCMNALSYQSMVSEKGVLLTKLQDLLNKNIELNPKQLESAFKELIRVTISYRKTWFFHAAYGETRSAKALVEAIKGADFNDLRPLVAQFFGGKDISAESDKEIVEQLRDLGKWNEWHEAVDELDAVVVF